MPKNLKLCVEVRALFSQSTASAGISLSEIANQLNRSKSTISRELRRLTIISAHPNRKAERIANSNIEALNRYPDKTVTYDNAKEFAQHERISKALNIDVFLPNLTRRISVVQTKKLTA